MAQRYARPRDRFTIGVLTLIAASIEFQHGHAAEPTISELSESMVRRFASYDNVEFTYDVMTHATPSPEATPGLSSPLITDGVIVSTDTFRIARQTPNDQSAPSRPKTCWIRRVSDEYGNERLDRFIAFDGSKSAQLRRERRRFSGILVPWEDWEDCNENVFEQFLFLRINGTNEAIDVRNDFRDFNLDRYRIVDTKQVDDRKAYVLKSRGISGNPAFEDIEYTVEVAGDPYFMVTRFQAEDVKNSRKLLLYEVKEIESFDSIAYPASGTYRQLAIRELPNHTYEFEVVSVKRPGETGETNGDRWLPEWPAGTIVRDELTGTNYIAK